VGQFDLILNCRFAGSCHAGLDPASLFEEYKRHRVGPGVTKLRKNRKQDKLTHYPATTFSRTLQILPYFCGHQLIARHEFQLIADTGKKNKTEEIRAYHGHG